MSKNLRISLFGVTGALAGFVLQGCFTPQPTPECSVTTTAAGQGLGPYFVTLQKTSGTGTCSELTYMRIGMMRYRTKPSGGAFTVGVRPSLVADPYLHGTDLVLDVDPANNCVNEDDCLGEGDLANMCVVSPVQTYDGTPVVGTTATPTDGGAPFDIDPANDCVVVEDEFTLERSDPLDPDGKNLTGIGQMPQFPSNNVCSITNVVGAVQNFPEEVIDLVDGGAEVFPAITYKAEFTDFNVITSTKVPGTAFTANIKYTEGSCVAEYKAVGFWPEIGCASDADCNPAPDLDAGHVTGSGINPDFKPKCDLVLEVCVPTVDVTTIK